MISGSISGFEDVTILLVLDFKSGSISGVLEKLIPSISKTRSEHGNIEFNIFQVVDRPDRLVISERWATRADLEEHWRKPYTVEALSLFEQHLETPPRRGENELFLLDVTKTA